MNSYTHTPMKTLLGGLILVAGLTSAQAASTYYVDSNTGNDNLDGRSALASSSTGPWKTLGRLAAASLQPGDKVVLACASVWRETLRISGAGTQRYPITIGMPSSGCAQRPTIDGSIQIPASSWRGYQGLVYQTQLPGHTPLQLFSASGTWLPAYHPNRGQNPASPASPYVPMAGNGDQVVLGGRVRGTSVVTGNELRVPMGASIVPGAVVRVRTTAWAIEERRVTAINGSKLVLDSPTDYPTNQGWGYYLMNLPWMVDSPGEWHYDAGTGRLLAWMPNSAAPSAPVFATVLSTGVDLQGSAFIILDGVVIKRVGTGIKISNSRSGVVRNVSIEDTAWVGADVAGSTSLTLEANSITRSAKDAILGFGSQGLIVRDNTIRDSGVIGTGGAASGLPERSFAAIYAGSNSVVEGNSITNAGYVGIRYMHGSRVERNVLNGMCLVLDDCGAIYTWGENPNNSAVRQNVVSNVVGNLDGKPPGTRTAAQGIYLDDNTSGVLVEGNTVSGADNGIQVHVASRNIIRDNVLYANRRSQLWMQANVNKVNSAGDVFENEITGNQFGVSAGAVAIYLDGSWASTSHFGSFGGNRYLDTSASTVVRERTTAGTRDFTFRQWQASSRVGSTTPVDGDGFSVRDTGNGGTTATGPNLITNSQLATNAAGWSHWNGLQPSGRLQREVCPAGFCLRYIPGGSVGLVSSPNFSIHQDQWYRMTIDLSAEQPNQLVTVVVRRGGGGVNGYESVSDRSITFVAASEWRRYSVIFKATKTINQKDAVTKDNGARIDVANLSAGRSVSLANLELVPVNSPATKSEFGFVNGSSVARQAACPLEGSSQAADCVRLVRLSNSVSAVWPLALPPFKGELVYLREADLVDSDGDGISDQADKCPDSPPTSVNAAGCALSQR